MRTAAIAVAVIALTAGLVGAGDGAQTHFVVRALVSDRALGASSHDPQLVNAWGLASMKAGPWWVANEGRGTSTLYTSAGRKQLLTVAVAGGPTGVVFNGGTGFVIGHGEHAAPARFLYACEDGRIRAWSPTVPHGWSKQTVVAVDGAGTAAVFKGLALTHGRLYVTDFHNGHVLVFDRHWRPVVLRHAFVDPSIPSWYTPFNIIAAGDRLFVSYSWPAPVNGNDMPSGGYVDEFDLQGKLVARIGRSADFAEPWGLAFAPRDFGQFGGDLLVANFGSGQIDAFAPRRGRWVSAGRLDVTVPGIWGIAFGTGGMSGPPTTLFFTAGPHHWLGSSELEVHGELGSIAPG